MPLTAGTKLGPYEIVGAIGAGGMGEVYRARDTRLNREVALKVLPAAFAKDTERLRRFEQEARAASALNHPNILAVYDIGTHEGVPFLITELLEGETLRERLRAGPLPVRKALDVVVQAAHGVAAAHEKGIVHRDLKPANVFLTNDGRVKILDFGLAKLTKGDGSSLSETQSPTRTVSPLTQTEAGVVLGTVGYMSPEQVRGKPADARSDIFALGTILYEMLSGQRAFEKDSSADTMAAILKEEPPELSGEEKKIPPAVERVVRHCLEKNSAERFQSARDLAFDLESLSELSTSHAPVNDGRRVKIPSAAFLTAAVAAMAVALAAGGLFKRSGVRPVQFAQLTNDTFPKNDMNWPPPASATPLVTDGSRIYFTARLPGTIAAPVEVSAQGGEVVRMNVPFSNAVVLGSSPDGSELVMESFTANEVEVPTWTIPMTGGSPQKIDDIRAHDFSWAPDKSTFVFCSGDGLWLGRESEGAPQKLFTAPSGGTVQWPRWSKGGRILRFTVEYPMKWSSEIWEVAADGSKAHVLLAGWNKPGIECCGDWTADGRYYVFESGSQTSSQIWAVRDGWLGVSAPFPVTAGPLSFTSPLPSPDGKHLYVVGSQSHQELARLDSKTGQLITMPDIPSSSSVDYSRDGQWVAYTTLPDGILWRSRADGGDRLQLTHPPDIAAGARWSPDGKRIAFTAVSIGHVPQIKIISIDGGTAEMIAPETREQAWPTWSPDGKSIIFGRQPWLEVGKLLPIRLMRADIASHATSELPSTEDLLAPTLSPDGRLIAGLHGEELRPAVYDLSTGQTMQFGEVGASRPAWTRDGSSAFYIYTGKLIRWDKSTRAVVTVAENSSFRLSADITVEATALLTVLPDGSPAIGRSRDTDQIYSLVWPLQ